MLLPAIWDDAQIRLDGVLPDGSKRAFILRNYYHAAPWLYHSPGSFAATDVQRYQTFSSTFTSLYWIT